MVPDLWAVIPVAGAGSWLRPHTHTRPKPLLPVAGQPIPGHILDPLLAVGIRRIVLVTPGTWASRLWSTCGATGFRSERWVVLVGWPGAVLPSPFPPLPLSPWGRVVVG